jgi:hypothetical protein
VPDYAVPIEIMEAAATLVKWAKQLHRGCEEHEVFAPLDAAFAERPIDVMLVTFVAGWALVAIALGIVMEVGE